MLKIGKRPKLDTSLRGSVSNWDFGGGGSIPVTTDVDFFYRQNAKVGQKKSEKSESYFEHRLTNQVDYLHWFLSILGSQSPIFGIF